MQAVAETPIFTRQTDKLFSEDEKQELIDFLAENPFRGLKYLERAAFANCGLPHQDAASRVAHG